MRISEECTATLESGTDEDDTSSEMCCGVRYVGACSLPSKRLELTLPHSVMYFIWQGRPENIKREVVQTPPESGGFNIFNIKLMCVALAISHTCKVIVEEGHAAKTCLIGGSGVSLIPPKFRCNAYR